MENFFYHVPFYVVTGGVATQGHSKDLSVGQVGLYDRHTWHVGTKIGNGKEFFFAHGTNFGLDFYGNPVNQSHKSPFFMGVDVLGMKKVIPNRIQHQEWIIGYSGAQSSVGLKYVKGQPLTLNFLFQGDPTSRFFGGTGFKQYSVTYTPEGDCQDLPCTGDCVEEVLDCKYHTIKHIDLLNNHVELRKFGLHASLVVFPFTSATPNMEKFQLRVCDNGDAQALDAVRSQYPTVVINRVDRIGSTSVYEFCQPIADAAPANFAQSGSVSLAICGTCPVGATTVAASDVWVVTRPLSGTEDLNDVAAQQTYANTVGTSYTAVSSTFLGIHEGVARVKINVAIDTDVQPALADTVDFITTVDAQCIFPAPASIAWTASGSGIRSKRTMKIDGIARPDCNVAGNRVGDLTTILSGVQGIDIGTLTVIAGDNCFDDYTVEQWSDDCLSEEACLTNEVSFNYNALPAFEGRSWTEIVDNTAPETPSKCGIRISGTYPNPTFSNCSFDYYEYYAKKPLMFEVSLIEKDLGACYFKNLPTITKTKEGVELNGSGEWVVREWLSKLDAYQRGSVFFDNSPRMREAFQMNALGMVDRNAFYNVYYVDILASYGYKTTYRKGEQEKFTVVFAFKENDPAQFDFENRILDVLSAKSEHEIHLEIINPKYIKQ